MTLWVVRCGGDGSYEQEAIEQKIVGIGWGNLGDISKINERDELMAHYLAKSGTETVRSVINQVSQVFAFKSRLQIGDLVALPLKNSASIAFGRVTGDYKFVPNAHRFVIHQRSVSWLKEIPRSQMDQDLLFSFGAFLTVFQVKRNNAEARVLALLSGAKTPMIQSDSITTETDADAVLAENFDVEQFSRDQIRKTIEQKYSGHSLAALIGEILRAEGYTVLVSPPGADGGVDVLAGSGPSGFEEPTIAVQVKSGSIVVDAPTLLALKGAMQNFGARKGLVVSWSGFTSQALKDVRKSFLTMHTWNSDDIIDHITANWERLPEEIKTVLRLKQIWAVIPNLEN
jgi:restriction system protein